MRISTFTPDSISKLRRTLARVENIARNQQPTRRRLYPTGRGGSEIVFMRLNGTSTLYAMGGGPRTADLVEWEDGAWVVIEEGLSISPEIMLGVYVQRTAYDAVPAMYLDEQYYAIGSFEFAWPEVYACEDIYGPDPKRVRLMPVFPLDEVNEYDVPATLLCIPAVSKGSIVSLAYREGAGFYIWGICCPAPFVVDIEYLPEP